MRIVDEGAKKVRPRGAARYHRTIATTPQIGVIATCPPYLMKSIVTLPAIFVRDR